jgi:hypothetical protein
MENVTGFTAKLVSHSELKLEDTKVSPRSILSPLLQLFLYLRSITLQKLFNSFLRRLMLLLVLQAFQSPQISLTCVLQRWNWQLGQLVLVGPGV